MKDYMTYLAKYGKSYNNSFEFDGRFKVWKQTDAFIKEWMYNHVSNKWIDEVEEYFSPKNKKHTHTVAHNKFSDWSEEEINSLLVLEAHVGKEEIQRNS